MILRMSESDFTVRIWKLMSLRQAINNDHIKREVRVPFEGF